MKQQIVQLDLSFSWAFGVKWSPSGNTLAYVGQKFTSSSKIKFMAWHAFHDIWVIIFTFYTLDGFISYLEQGLDQNNKLTMHLYLALKPTIT